VLGEVRKPDSVLGDLALQLGRQRSPNMVQTLCDPHLPMETVFSRRCTAQWRGAFDEFLVVCECPYQRESLTRCEQEPQQINCENLNRAKRSRPLPVSHLCSIASASWCCNVARRRQESVQAHRLTPRIHSPRDPERPWP